MEDMESLLCQFMAGLTAVIVENTKLNALGSLTPQSNIDAEAVVGDSEWMSPTRTSEWSVGFGHALTL